MDVPRRVSGDYYHSVLTSHRGREHAGEDVGVSPLLHGQGEAVFVRNRRQHEAIGKA